MRLPDDLRYAVRSLLKSPVFLLVGVLSLALGIGANTAVFTLLDQVLLELLPVDNPQQLVQLKENGAFYGSSTGDNAFSYPIYQDLSSQNRVFSGMFCTSQSPMSATFDNRSERALGELVSGTYFPVMGIRPELGRLFTTQEDGAPGTSPFAVLSYAYWQSRFAGDPSIIGKEIVVNNRKLTIAGVAKQGFDGIEPLFATQIYVPVTMAAQVLAEEHPLENRRRRWIQVFGRLKAGITQARAQASLQPIFHSVLEMEVQQAEFAHASAHAREQFLKMTVSVMPGGGGQNLVAPILGPALWAMMAMVGLVLMIACANVANLMIARAASRQKEIAVRLALGAGRWRIVKQLLIESALLSIAGAALGLVASPWIMRLLLAIMPRIDPPLTFVTDPNMNVLYFNLALCVLTTLLFGLIPALQSTRPDLAPTLKDQAGAVAAGGQSRWRKSLVTAQVSLSLLLLIGAGLFVRSLKNLKNLDPGFRVANLVAFELDPTLNGYKPEQAKLFYRQLADRLAAIPGSRSTALAVVGVLNFNSWDATITVAGYTPKTGEDMDPNLNYVSPRFFETLAIPVFAGRDFSDSDRVGTPKVAIVNEKFARHYFGDRGAIGRRIGMGGDPGTKTDIEIVGVVRDTRYRTMRDDPPREIYLPYQQSTWASEMTAYVRTGLPSDQVFPAMRDAVRKLDPNLPVYSMKTMEDTRDDSLAVERLAASLSTAFGVLATMLAAIGLYGVMAFLVTRRTREIGIRMALGAMTGNVVWLVMREVLFLAGLGVAIGLPAAFAVTRLVGSQLYGIESYDPVTIVGATLGLLAIAAVSGYIPTRRATHIDPIKALHYD